jgi:hypothetical protein
MGRTTLLGVLPTVVSPGAIWAQVEQRRPDPPGQVLNWVCRDNLSYLDLTQNRLEMDPD